jgi:hypothetical protein
MDSKSPSHAATIAWGSMALWYWAGVVGGIDPDRCRREGRFNIAQLHLGRIADADDRRDEAFVGIETDTGRLRFVSRRQERRSLRRGLQRLGDHHRDRLVRITHLIILQKVEPEHERVRLSVRIVRERRPIGRGHDIDDARVALGSLHAKEGHATACDAADRQNRIKHPGRVIIRCVAGCSGDLQDAVNAGQRLTDIRAMSDMERSLGEGDLRRHGVLREWMRRGRPEVPEHAREFPPQRASGRAGGSAARARF